VKEGLANEDDALDAVNDIIDYDDELAADEDKVIEELHNVVRTIPVYENGERYTAIQVFHDSEENLSYFYELMLKVVTPKMVTPYAEGFSGCYDSKEGSSGDVFFVKKDGDVVWAGDLAKQLLV